MTLPPATARRCCLAVALLLACVLAPAQSVARPVTVAVLGDSIATELGRGMQTLFAHQPHVRVIKQTKFSTGLVRTDYFDWNAALRRFLRHHRPDLIVVTLGGNDRQSVDVRGRRLERFSPAWTRDYERRVARFMDVLARSHAKVFWVGLPIVERADMTRDYARLNRVFRREAARHKFTYVSLRDVFANARGAYTSFGRALDGRRQRLRKTDGMHFTEQGSLVMAAHVAAAMGLR